MEYTLVYDNIPDQLIQKVNKLIGEGWEPIGGIAVTRNDVEEVFYQALVKKNSIGFPENLYPNVRF